MEQNTSPTSRQFISSDTLHSCDALCENPRLLLSLSACSQGCSHKYLSSFLPHTNICICINQCCSLTSLQLALGNPVWPHGFISIYFGQWLPTLLSYCYIKEHSISSQAESCWLCSSALIRYVIRPYFLELPIDQRYDQWQPLNISMSIFSKIFSFKRAYKCFRTYRPSLGFIFFPLKFDILSAAVLVLNLIEVTGFLQVQVISDAFIIMSISKLLDTVVAC